MSSSVIAESPFGPGEVAVSLFFSSGLDLFALLLLADDVPDDADDDLERSFVFLQSFASKRGI